ncbi:hypothetical protein FIBSPDRAFT_924244 [Athelia psychrophila]|uniref:protein-tyrosine-phosphatase n=1 Tax=Athelia psychrophila TaxID=1759441 RepID=A0A166WIX6_9AGAM|nr:hypothetical protein FIBSPDRAFT_924244 [Fibularhizoctonia sp. CBS 109695]
MLAVQKPVDQATADTDETKVNSVGLVLPRPAPPVTRLSNEAQVGSRKRLSCKMCRQELATSDNTLDHGQFGPSAREFGRPEPAPFAGLAVLRSEKVAESEQHVSSPSLQSPLANPECSGYFVQPMRWMDPFLKGGPTSGRIRCPNTKCGAKLGCYDWAGLCCGCHVGGKWVTPGFCINRSKVDEILR